MGVMLYHALTGRFRGVIGILENEYPGRFDRFAGGDGSSEQEWDSNSDSGSTGGSGWASRDDMNGATPISIP